MLMMDGGVLIFIVSTLIELTTAQSYNSTKSLFSDKLSSNNYDPQIRPLINQSNILNVGVSFELISIVDIDDVTQSFTANGFLLFLWRDELLNWDPASYDGLKVVHPIPENIWRPRVVLINTLGDRDLFKDDKAPVFVNYGGIVNWAPGSLFPVSCQLDVTSFPFDQQSCVIKLVAMTQSVDEMRFSAINSTIQKTFFITHGEWDLLAATINITEVITSGTYLSTIDMIFVMKRRPAFLLINVVLPIVFLSFLNIMVFVIPADSGEKISYGITVLLALAVYLSTVSSMLPRSSVSMPKLTTYLFILLIISVLTVVDSIIIVFLAAMEEKEIRHRQAKDSLQTAVTKISVFRRATTALSNITKNKVNSETNTTHPILSPMSEHKEYCDRGVNSPLEESTKINSYKIIGKHIDRISFLVFLLVWLGVTVGFMIDISSS